MVSTDRYFVFQVVFSIFKHFAILFTSFASHDMIGDIQIFSVFHVNYFNIFLAQNVGNFEIDGFKSEIVMCIIKNVIKKGLIM